MNNPNVSVIMPVYNGEKYLEESIDSILNQTFSDFEFIIADDGSTDNSLQIIRSYRDARIKIVINSENLGLVKTLNKLLDVATGTYVAKQHSDDISLPERLEKQVMFLEKHPEVGLCGTNAIVFGEKRKTSKTLLPIKDEEIRSFMIIGCPFFHPTVMYRKSVFFDLKIPKYNEVYFPAEDYAMWFEVSKKTAMANLPDYLFKYRFHQNNITKLQADNIYRKSQRVRKDILKYFLSYEVSEEESKLFRLISNPRIGSINDIQLFEKLLIRILRKNKEIKYYNEQMLRNLILRYWLKTCLKNPNVDFISKFKLVASSKLLNFFGVLNLFSIKYLKKYLEGI